MRTDRIAESPWTMDHRLACSQSGQALAEMTVGLIALAVAFLAIFLIGDMARARQQALLDARRQAGPNAMAGMILGSPQLYGSADAAVNLQKVILKPMETPIAYHEYIPPTYPYIEKNLVTPIYNNGDAISAFSLTMVEATRYVTNSPFLKSMGIGGQDLFIPITQKACLPKMKDFQ